MDKAIRDAVFIRDHQCILAKLIPDHECRDMWGQPMHPADLQGLTIEHVKSELRMGVRAPDDMAHCVVICYGSNVGVPSKYERGQLRMYLEAVNADPHAAHVDPCGPDCRAGVVA